MVYHTNRTEYLSPLLVRDVLHKPSNIRLKQSKDRSLFFVEKTEFNFYCYFLYFLVKRVRYNTIRWQVAGKQYLFTCGQLTLSGHVSKTREIMHYVHQYEYATIELIDYLIL